MPGLAVDEALAGPNGEGLLDLCDRCRAKMHCGHITEVGRALGTGKLPKPRLGMGKSGGATACGVATNPLRYRCLAKAQSVKYFEILFG